MRVGFVVNNVETEEAKYTTVRLALAATRRGHDTWLMGVADFSHEPDGSVGARARSSSHKRFKSPERYLENLRGDSGTEERIRVDDLDVLVMRNDPAEDASDRPWAVTSGVLFGQLAVTRGVLVVNDPASLANAINKTYFQHFPDAARPRTLISRDVDAITAFVEERGGHGRAQAPAGLWRLERVPGLRRGIAEPQPDHRGHPARRLRRGPGAPRRRRGW